MRFGTWPRPRVEVIVRCFRSELGDEVVGGLAETTEGRERDGLLEKGPSSKTVG